jgi:glucosamine-6-phosphate deaminase
MSVLVWPEPDAAGAAADLLEDAIQCARAKRGRAVLGLATGTTPKRVYAELARRHRLGRLSFQQVTTYNLDEYYPISPFDSRSYRTYMHEHLFSQVDLPPNQAHLLDGTVPEAFVAEHAAEFDRWIECDGGLDIQLLGIGRNGHIGFNEPSDLTLAAALRLPSRLVELHPVTRADAACELGGPDRVIPRALTLGVRSILAARSIVILASGSHKAAVVAAALTGPMTPSVPASLLQSVADRVTWILDQRAAERIL